VSRFQSILLHAGLGPGGPPAIERTLVVARRHGAAVRVVDIIAPPPVYARPFLTDDLSAIVEEHHTRHLEETLERFQREGVRATGEILRGRPAHQIVGAVLRHRHDLVVRGDKGAVEGKPASFGPSDIELLRECPCPVWMVRPRETPAYERIVAAIDPEGYEEDHDALNRRIVEAALDVAELSAAVVLALSVWSPFGESLLQPRLSEEELVRWMRDVHDEARTARDRVLDGFGTRGRNVQRHLAKGEPARILAEFADNHGAALLVMGSVGRVGIPGLVMGNTAERVLRDVACDVLVLKPEGFVPHIVREGEVPEGHA